MNKKIFTASLTLLLLTSIFMTRPFSDSVIKAKANSTPPRWITVPIAELLFDPQNPTIETGYSGLSFSTLNGGSIQYETSVAMRGAALNISTMRSGIAYFTWLIRDTYSYAQQKSVWYEYGLHYNFSIYQKSSPASGLFPVIKFYQAGTGASTPQFYIDDGKAYIKNSTDNMESAVAFSADAWHWVDINFDFQNKTIRVYWDTYDSPKLIIPETSVNFDTVCGINTFGDDTADDSYGECIIDEIQILGDAPIANTGKPVYYTEVLPFKGSQSYTMQVIEKINTTCNIKYTILLSNQTGDNNLGNSTLTDAIKNFLTYHPDSIVGLWAGLLWSYKTEYIQAQLQSFYDVFGYYPKAIGAYTLNQKYVEICKQPPYNVTAFLSHTDDANMFTQFTNYPMFISDKAQMVPSLVNSSGVVGFQWASTHPFWYLTEDTNFLTQSDYYYQSSFCGNTVAQQAMQWLIYEINNTQYNDFGYITNGIESGLNWINGTLANHFFNWTIDIWDNLIMQYSDVIQSKTLLDVADLMLQNYLETPLYVLHYPWFRDPSQTRDIWIIENSAYQVWILRNETSFQICRLQVFGNTTAYNHYEDGGKIFTYQASYSEIIRSVTDSNNPMHGISIDGFYPTTLDVSVTRSTYNYATVVASNNNTKWTMQFLSGSMYYMLFDVQSLTQQTVNLKMQFTASRNETRVGRNTLWDWGAIFRIDDAVYNYDNLTAVSGTNIVVGFNHSAILVHPLQTKMASISKEALLTGTNSVVISYPFTMKTDEKARIMLVLGLNASQPITNIPLLMEQISFAFVVNVAVTIGAVSIFGGIILILYRHRKLRR